MQDIQLHVSASMGNISFSTWQRISQNKRNRVLPRHWHSTGISGLAASSLSALRKDVKHPAQSTRIEQSREQPGLFADSVLNPLPCTKRGNLLDDLSDCPSLAGTRGCWAAVYNFNQNGVKIPFQRCKRSTCSRPLANKLPCSMATAVVYCSKYGKLLCSCTPVGSDRVL